MIDLGGNRSEYVNAINESDFVACPRGDANQSARFYESLSAARIPVLPDTSVIFPHALGRLTPNHLITFPPCSVRINALISNYYEATTNQTDYDRLQDELRRYILENFRFETFIRGIFGSSIGHFMKIAHLG